MAPSTADRPARSLADDLRGRSPDQIAALLELRPDLLQPWPADLGQLARRAADDASVLEAMQSLDTTALRVLEAFACLHESTVEAVVEGLPEGQEAVREAAQRLWLMALLWGGPDTLRIVRAAREVFGPHPCGLAAGGHRAVDPAAVREAAQDMGPDRLRRLVWTDPVDRGPHPLLVVRGEQYVLPREASLVLREGRLLADAPPRPDLPAAPDRPAGVSLWFPVAGVRYLLTDLSREPLPWHPDRGVPRRALLDRAARMAVPAEDLAVWLELGAQAGLVGGVQQQARITGTAPEWLASPPQDMWAALITAWLDSDRPLRQCLPDGRGTLTTGGVARYAHLKSHVLQCWPVRCRAGAEDLVAAVSWGRPRMHRAVDIAREVHAEAVMLGLVENDVATPAMDSLARCHGPDPACFPAPAAAPSLIVQPDNTVVAPLQLDGATWRLLHETSVVESWGPVTVHRLDPPRLASALHSPDEVVEMLTAASRTPLPQSVVYRIRDTRADHAAVSRATVVRWAGDPALLADRGLQQVGPGVFVTELEPDQVRRRLGEKGVPVSVDPPREPAPPLDHVPSVRRQDPGAVRRLVQRLAGPPVRVEDEPPDLHPADPATIGSTCRDAIARGEPLWLRYADSDGTRVELVEPIDLRSGTLTGWSLHSGRAVGIPIARITAHGGHR